MTYTLLGLPHWLPRPGGKGMRGHETRLRRSVGDLVKARRASATGEDLLAKLARASDPESGQAMTDANLVDNIVAFLMAGYDTTAFALTFSLYLIARSPEWEARMREEVVRVAGEGPVTAGHVALLTVVQPRDSCRLGKPPPPVLWCNEVNWPDQFNGRHTMGGRPCACPQSVCFCPAQRSR